MSQQAVLPKKLMLSIAVAQGLLLFALYKAEDLKVWPSDAPLWNYPLWTLAIAVPVLLLDEVTTRDESPVGVSGSLAGAIFTSAT